MKSFLILILWIIGFIFYVEIGINTINPEKQLIIRDSNHAASDKTDPRINIFPITPPTVDEKCMLVFLTIDNTFHFLDQPDATWVDLTYTVVTSDKTDDLTDGKPDNDGTEGGSSVFLGLDTGVVDYETDPKNTGIGFKSLFANCVNSQNTSMGQRNGYNDQQENRNTILSKDAGYIETLENRSLNMLLGYRLEYKRQIIIRYSSIMTIIPNSRAVENIIITY